MARLTPGQRRVVRKSLRAANRLGASHKTKKALLEAEAVESNFRNLPYGDADSEGPLQQRPSQGWGTRKQVRNIPHAVKEFVTRAERIKGQYGSAGKLAQAVQRSAYPDRYGQQAKLASALLRGHGGGGGGRTLTTPGVDNSNQRHAIIAQYLLDRDSSRPDPSRSSVAQGILNDPLVSLVAQLHASKDVPGHKVRVHGASAGSGTHTGRKGTAVFEGVRVAAWIKPELEYARHHGWKGKVTSGFRSFADQTRIYNSGVRPAAKPGSSNHEGADYPRGAVDVSDAQTLSRILRARHSKLKFAGAKDPVHFSHPHGGSY